MNENDTTQTPTPQPTPTTPDATAANPAAAEDGPPVSTAPVLSPQEQIDAEAEAEVQAELRRLMGDGNGEQTGTEDGGGNAGVPVVETPDATATPGETPPATPPATPTETQPTTPATPKDQAQLDAERAAYGKLGGRISQLEAKLAEAEAKLAAQAAAAAPGTPPANAGEPPATTPPAGKPPASILDAEITDEERREILGEDWENDWGKDGADEEIRRRRRSFDFYNKKFGTGDARQLVKAEISAERESARREQALDSFLDDLDKAVPTAAQLDRDAKTNGFAAYLDGYAPGSMATRRQTLTEALKTAQRGDATREEYDRALDVAKSIYQQFATQSPSQGQPAKPASIDPAKLAMPRIAGGAATPPAAAPKGKSYTEAEVSAALDKAAESQDPGLYERVQAWAEKLYREGKVK